MADGLLSKEQSVLATTVDSKEFRSSVVLLTTPGMQQIQFVVPKAESP